MTQGIAEGKARAMAEGKADGRIETFAHLLKRRFGPLPERAAARLESATPEQLDQLIGLVARGRRRSKTVEATRSSPAGRVCRLAEDRRALEGEPSLLRTRG